MLGHQPAGAQLLGSVPLPDAETVFRTVGGTLGRHLRRLPDGETGERINWFSWQGARFAECPGLEPVPAAVLAGRPQLGRTERPRYQRRPGVAEADIAFGPLGYAAAGTASYELFARLKRAGALPAHLRFQVSLPTP